MIHGSFGRIKKIHNNVEHREFTAADETIFGAMGFQFGRICDHSGVRYSKPEIKVL